VGVIAGQIELPVHLWRDAGIDAALGWVEPGVDLGFALAHCAELLAEAAGRFATLHLDV